MRSRLTLALLVGATLATQPVQSRAEYDSVTLRGAWEYHEACSNCHGPDGAGDGPMGTLLKIPPADLTRLSERNGGSFPFERVFEVIDGRAPVEGHGSREMPIWGRIFLQEQITEGGARLLAPDPNLVVSGRIFALAKYLRAIQGGQKVPLIQPTRPRRHWPEDIPPVWPNLP